MRASFQAPSERAVGQAPLGLIPAVPRQVTQPLKSNARHVSLKAGEVLFHKGDASDGCYWINRGILKATSMSSNGEERILGLLGPGEVVGELAMLDGGPRSATVQAIRPSELYFVSRNGLNSLFLTDGALLQQLLDTLVRRLRKADEEAAASFQPIGVRVARALVEMMDIFGEKEDPAGRVVVTRHLRQTDIAALAGVSRESVTRVIASLKRQGILEQLGRFSYRIDCVRLEIEAQGQQ